MEEWEPCDLDLSVSNDSNGWDLFQTYADSRLAMGLSVNNWEPWKGSFGADGTIQHK